MAHVRSDAISSPILDSTYPNQTLLFNLEPSIYPLAADMAAKLRSADEVSVKRVKAYVHRGTAYLRKHMGEALLQLETEIKLKVAENKSGGKKRRAKSFPNELLVTFTSPHP